MQISDFLQKGSRRFADLLSAKRRLFLYGIFICKAIHLYIFVSPNTCFSSVSASLNAYLPISFTAVTAILPARFTALAAIFMGRRS